MKMRLLCIVALVSLLLPGCSKQPVTEPLYSFTPPTKTISYTTEVKPILEKRCVVCHSCYNSPCQLKFSSWEGVERGANKERIYNADRLSPMEPSRLFVDAESTLEWREKGFYKVLPGEDGTPYNDSIIFTLLDHKRKRPGLLGKCGREEEFLPEDEDEGLTCPDSTAEVNSFLKAHPNRGMPFGFPPLTEQQFNLVAGWLTQGAPGPTDREREVAKAVPEDEREWLWIWEELLNTRDPKHRLLARYLYEHLFLAHINFQPDSTTFYELVRSKTPPGEKIKIIATRRPYDDPQSSHVYYRFRKIHSTLVYKTHMVFTMDRRQFDLVNKLFVESDWSTSGESMSYGRIRSANPFESFQDIPPRSRYEWLLDNAHYIIMNFIRGPVCKGQVALNVVNDHFWLFFMDPDFDVSVTHPGFLAEYAGKLRMPAEKGSGLGLLKALFSFKKKYKPWVLDYYQARQEKYATVYPKGLGPEAIWVDPRGGDNGADLPERERRQSLLTIFRHFDSATVHRGAVGKIPKTVWVVDYPILERIYYALVAGFDVYGTKGHQGTTRKYMDSLRIEAESAFLEFLPPQQRVAIMQSWYQQLKNPDDLYYHPTTTQAGFDFSESCAHKGEQAGSCYKMEFLQYLVDKMHLQVDANFTIEAEGVKGLPALSKTENWIRGFQAVVAKKDSFFKRVEDHSANIAWVKVAGAEKNYYLTVFVDRWHKNVNYMEGEELALDPAKDRADVLAGLWGAYPNYFFVVEEDKMEDFWRILGDYSRDDFDICRLESYGINRAEPEFWEIYDDFQTTFDAQHGERGGFIDLNRYYSRAMDERLYRGGNQQRCMVVAKEIQQERPWWKKLLQVPR